MATLKQQKTAQITVENGGNKPLMTKGDILKQVGYSMAVIKNPAKVFNAAGYKESLQELAIKYGIDKQSRMMLMSEIMHDRNQDGSLKDKRAVIEAQKEVSKTFGEYEQVQRVQEMESDQDKYIE